MLNWKTKTQITDADVTSSADAVIFFDLKEPGYMPKLSAVAKKAGLYDYKQNVGPIF